MTLQSLITRVEAGSGSDRQLDADICVALQWIGIPQSDYIPAIGNMREDEPGWLIFDEGDDADNVTTTPNLTSSLDAIRALFKARLEGWSVSTCDATNIPPTSVIWQGGIEDVNDHCRSENPDIHRAFLCAILKAIEAQTEQK